MARENKITLMVSDKLWWPLFRMHSLERPACYKYMPQTRWTMRSTRLMTQGSTNSAYRRPRGGEEKDCNPRIPEIQASQKTLRKNSVPSIRVTSNTGCTWPPFPKWKVRPVNYPYVRTVNVWRPSWSTNWHSGYSEQKNHDQIEYCWSFLHWSNRLFTVKDEAYWTKALHHEGPWN